jgi:SWI/SNF-related matrix-associated actin-dependent regulator of chromatin subfamily A member 5
MGSDDSVYSEDSASSTSSKELHNEAQTLRKDANGASGPPTVKKYKAAFMWYQTIKLGEIRSELGPSASMGTAMNTLGARWKALSSDERQKYLDMEAEDRERYEKECELADAWALQEQERKRQAQTIQIGDQIEYDENGQARFHKTRQVRKSVEAQRVQDDDSDEKEEKVLTEKQKRRMAEVHERRQARLAEQEALDRKHNKLSKEEAKKASQRLEYLLKQSSMFAKLQGKSKSEKQSAEAGKQTVHHRHDEKKPSGKKKGGGEDDEEKVEDEEDEELMDEDASEKHVFLSKQPTSIKFGQMKPYQLESLNWMIHLAEKGLNGILADEMGLVSLDAM